MIWPERKTNRHEAPGGTRFFADASILIHGRKTLAALPKSTPKSRYHHALVEKLFNAAAQTKADNVIFTIENQNLSSKATSAADKEKKAERSCQKRELFLFRMYSESVRNSKKKKKLMHRKKQKLLNAVQPKQQSSLHPPQPPSQSEAPKNPLPQSIVQIFSH